MNKEDQYERLTKFLESGMTPEERSAFEKELQDDPELREQLQFEQSLSEFFDQKLLADELFGAARDPEPALAAGTDSERERAPETAGRPERPAARRIRLLPAWVWLAAAACIVIALLVPLLFPAGTDKPEDPIVSHPPRPKAGKEAIPPTGDSIAKAPDVPKAPAVHKTPVRAGDSVSIASSVPALNFDSLFRAFFTKDEIPPPEERPRIIAGELLAYEASRYDSIQKFNLNLTFMGGASRVNNTQNVKEIGHYYKGLSYILTNQDKLATAQFRWISDSSRNGLLRSKSNWYLGLLWLKKGDTRKAIPLFTAVSKDKSNPYAQKAKELLRQLKP